VPARPPARLRHKVLGRGPGEGAFDTTQASSLRWYFCK